MKQLRNTLALFYIRVTFGLLGFVSPSLAAKRAWNFMCSPRRFPARPIEDEVLERATQSRLTYREGEVQLYSWGSGTKKILLVHGWEGRAGNFAALVDPLLVQDCTLLAFDAPSHGASDQQPTSMFDFADCLAHILSSHDVDVILSHSFGSVATALALSKLAETRVKELVMITTPNRFSDRINQVAEFLGLSLLTKEALIKEIEENTDIEVASLALSERCQELPLEQVLIVHDKADKVTPIAWAREIAAAWDIVTLIEIENTGHYRILIASQTEEAVVNFLFGSMPETLSSREIARA
ncbi:MAG: alpha/beta hydrolase [Chloroflexota bacterium]